MEDVITSPLQEIQQWIAPSSQCRIRDEYAPLLKPEKIPACKQGYAPFIISAETKTAARSFRVAHHKSAEHWVVKTQAEGSITRILEAIRILEATPTKAKGIDAEFNEQAEKWDNETAHLSSPAQRFLHPSYVAIMGMAQDNRDEVIKLLLRDLRDNRREWFWALSYLTHENPIDRRDSGSLDNMIRAWVQWGKTKGLL